MSLIALRVPAPENRFWHKKYVSFKSRCTLPVQLNNSKRKKINLKYVESMQSEENWEAFPIINNIKLSDFRGRFSNLSSAQLIRFFG